MDIREQIVDKRTPKERFIALLTSILNTGHRPYDLKTRGGGRSGISSATAYQTKSLVELLPQLSDVEIDELSQMKYTNRNGRAFEFKPYIEQFKLLAGQQQTKQDVKAVSTGKDQYAILIAAIKVKIEDFLVEQETKIAEDVTNSRKFIQEKKKTLTPKEFEETYGEKKYHRKPDGSRDMDNYYISMTMFYESRLGVLLRLSDANLPVFIAKAQKMYREKEYGKIDKLVYKLKTKYPNLSNFVMTNYRRGVDGIEFTLTADNPDGKVSIFTQTIYAGGYNIQRLHLRWLMHVNDSQGQRVKIEQG